MAEIRTNQYRPDVVSPPGETLRELLEGRGISQAELAERTGRPRKTINEIIRGKAAITPETALQLELVLGVEAGFWNRREQLYREYLERARQSERMKQAAQWAKQFPISAMAKRGWIKKTSDTVGQVKEVLQFFAVASPEQWANIHEREAVAFRQSSAFEVDAGAISAWLRQGRRIAEATNARPFDRDRFLSCLKEARRLTRYSPAESFPELQRMCSQAGVVVAFVPELPRCRVSGATRWVNSTTALIQLSSRHKTDDHLWFSFFHEAAHLLLHGKKRVFLEGTGNQNADEDRANRYAADMLIPSKPLAAFLREQDFSKRSIRSFAEDLGIAPGIVVGRLQHDEVIPRS
jgi:HTH-type transcriptional regulator/antitoxin HigA